MKYIFHDTMGSLFEEEISERIYHFSATVWGNGSFVASTMKVDQYGGTDFTLLGIPVDVTLNFHNKTYMKRLDTVVELEVGNIHFGIRYGNGKVKFEKPVLTIGFDFPGLTKSNISMFGKFTAAKLQEILDTGMDLYLDVVEA